MCGFRHAEFVQTEEGALLVEQPEDGLLTPDRRRGCDADVERATVDLHGDLAVLGPSALDDVHPREDLHAADDRGPHVRRQREHVVQRSIDPVPDTDTRVLGLDVDIRGAIANALGDDQVHDLHDRRQVRGGLFVEIAGRQRLGCQERVHVPADRSKRLVRLVGGAPDVRGGRDHRDDGHAGRVADPGDGIRIERVRHRDLEALVRDLHRDRLMGARDRLGDERDRLVGGGVAAKVRERDVQMDRQHAGELEVVNGTELHEECAESLPRSGLLQQRLGDLTRPDQLLVDQQLPEEHACSRFTPFGLRGWCRRGHGRRRVGHNLVRGRVPPLLCAQFRSLHRSPPPREGARDGGVTRSGDSALPKPHLRGAMVPRPPQPAHPPHYLGPSDRSRARRFQVPREGGETRSI